MHDTIIIGAGPAGLTAGLYAGRYKLNTLILEKMAAGGQIILSDTIENFPGFPGGVTTQELMDRCRKQVEELKVPIEIEEVVEITSAGVSTTPVYTIKTREKVYETKSLIIATGAQPKRLGVNGEDRLIGRGVSYCATCDGPFFRNQEVTVVGGGDRAIEEAIFLTRYAKKVSVIHRRDNLRASKILVEKAWGNPKIQFFLENTVEEIIGQERMERVRVRNVRTGDAGAISCQGIFIFVGIKPSTDFLRSQITLDEAGFIVTADDLSTSAKGIFACGDCRKKTLYQVVTACADGAVAAASAQRYLL